MPACTVWRPAWRRWATSTVSNVEHYIRINFAGFISIIDAIGGVDVYSDQAFTSVGSPGYYDPTTFAEGWNHLDGKIALAFARERHAFKTGDIQRGINQMKVIDAMAEKLKSPALLMSFSKLMDAMADCFVTSLSQEQISALVRMQLSDLSSWDIQSYSVTGTGIKSTKCYSAKGQSLYVMKPDENSVNEAKALVAAVLGGEDKLTSTSQTPEKTDVHTPTADPNAAVSVPEETPDSVIVEEPAESVPEETPADGETTPETPADGEQSASTEAPAESEAQPAQGGETGGGKPRHLHAQSGTAGAGGLLPASGRFHGAGCSVWLLQLFGGHGSQRCQRRCINPDITRPPFHRNGGLAFLESAYFKISGSTLWPSRLEASTPR